jgi:hypothetical protein
MSNGEYPKWVTRAEGIGPVLCRNEKEERELLNSWETEQVEKAEAEAEAAKKLAAEAKEEAQVVLKQQGKGK